MMRPIHCRTRVLLLVAGIFSGAAFGVSPSPQVYDAQVGQSLESAVRANVAAVLLARRGARVIDPQQDIAWITPPEGELNTLDAMSPQTFVALAVPPGTNSRDLYRLQAKVTPYGRVYDDAWVVNLSQSQGADDGTLTVFRQHVATTVTYAGHTTAIEVRDLRGQDPVRAGTQDWGTVRRWGDAITNLERSGSPLGLTLNRYEVTKDDVPPALSLQFVGQKLQVRSPGTKDVVSAIDMQTHRCSGSLVFKHQPQQKKMKMDFLNWLADRGRGFADQGLGPRWAGDSIELLKEFYFKVGEAKAQIEEVATTDQPIKEEAPEVVEEAIKKAKLSTESRALPWPPAPLDAMLGERLKGEGLWTAVSADTVTHQPNAPSPFYTTYLRPDQKYARKRVHIAVWDPEQVSLNVRAGTREPVPQTGHRGDGRIPRKPELLKKVVAGFNGGFQTAHIWYGMMVDSKVLLRPREFGATAGSWADGRTAFGTWEPRAPIPKDLTGYRQNLPPLIEDGVYNPYRRRTWGWSRNVAGVVEGRTTRTALCYTYDGYIMYFYSEFANAKTLTSTLFHCQCRYAVHLDMNPGHTGFEFYKTLASDTQVSDPDSEKTVEGVRFKGSRLHKVVRHMKAPTRYLGVDYRDFFYLTLRNVIPGQNLAGAEPWQTQALPYNTEFPPRYAVTRVLNRNATIAQLDMRGLKASLVAADDDSIIEEQDKLVLSFPIGATANATEHITVGDIRIPGMKLDDAPSTPVSRGALIGKDSHGFIFVVLVENEIISDISKVLKNRLSHAVWIQSDHNEQALMYQTNENKELIEAPVGSSEGTLVKQPTRNVTRLLMHAQNRAPRIVRLFPEMKPRKRK